MYESIAFINICTYNFTTVFLMLYVGSYNDIYTSLEIVFPKTFHMLNGPYSTCLPFHKLLSDP